MATDLLEVRIGELLKARGWTISAAESCTGGLIMSRLTDISGSSAYVLGGAVTYSNEMKMALVKVKAETLAQYGAVSEQTAAEMAVGARQLFGTQVAVSVTGIAGPMGGTATKPVGLTYIGLSAEGLAEPRVIRRVWEGDRVQNKQSSADAALRLVIEYLEGL